MQPELTINGVEVAVPEDFRGYDQKVRDSFFGVIEVPVDYGILQVNNDIKLSFVDQGGFVTSMVLQVFEQSKQLQRTLSD